MERTYKFERKLEKGRNEIAKMLEREQREKENYQRGKKIISGKIEERKIRRLVLSDCLCSENITVQLSSERSLSGESSKNNLLNELQELIGTRCAH